MTAPAPRAHHGVFIVYTPRDQVEASLAQLVREGLGRLGLMAPTYDEVTLEHEGHGRLLHRSYGTWLDPVAVIERPIARARRDSAVNRQMLSDYFAQAAAVVCIAPRGLNPDPHARTDVDVLRRAARPPVIGVSWDERNASFLQEADVFVDYRIGDRRGNRLARHADNICGLIWMSRLLVTLAESRGAGWDVIKGVAPSHDTLAKAVARCPRFPESLRSWVWNAFNEGDSTPLDMADVAAAGDAESVQKIWRLWRGGGRTLLQHVLRGCGLASIRHALRALDEALDRFSETVEAQRGELAVLDTDARLSLADAELRVGDPREAADQYTAALAQTADRAAREMALMHRALARRDSGDTAGALDDYGAVADGEEFSSTARADALVQRGTLLSETRDDEAALVELDRVLAMQELSRYAWFTARLARAVSRRRIGHLAGSIEDYTAIIGDARVPRELKASALVNRAALRAALNEWPLAIGDCDALLAMREARPDQRVNGFLCRSQAYAEVGRPEDARRDLEAILHASTDHALREEVQRRLQEL